LLLINFIFCELNPGGAFASKESMRIIRPVLQQNSGLAKVAVQCSADIPIAIGIVVNQTFVFRINPDSYQDGKNRHLRQAAER